MRRRREQPDPELASIARQRLARALIRRTEPNGPAAGELAPIAGSPRRARSTVLGEADLARSPFASDAGGVPGEVVDRAGADRIGIEAGELDAYGLAPVGLDELAPPRRFGRWHLGVVVALVLLGLLWGGWSLLRGRPVALAAPAAVPSVPAPGGPSALPRSPSPSAPPRIVVHVLGAVAKPGLVTLPDRARVQDAIDAAGGLTRRADPGELNLAQPLADGEQVLIGTKGHGVGEVRGGSGADTAAPPGGSRASGSGSGAALDLNRATSIQLQALPGVGPVTATKIVAWRDQHGRFSRPDELQEVDGIGPKTYAQIAPHVRV